ncbi:ATP-grasp domain-containing protein [Pseudomonas sp. CGJS7]|uniref:ATP-grasp domain-containing protein n=1 Tax=Pseudomonas sp. CGJS7 TaxID=3109348 RepID=UPI00300A9757
MSANALVILTHVLHPAVTEGFIPAARRLGLPVVLLTDCRLDHLEHFSANPEFAPQQIVECDVFNPLSAIDALRTLGIEPAAVFSNSDHLQTSTALVAQNFGLPGKDWRVCYAAKNKAATRKRLDELGLPAPWFHSWNQGQPLPADTRYPVVAKPREGVASLDVQLCATPGELQAYGQTFWSRFPGRTVLLEGFLRGPLFTLETLSDGRHSRAVGGFDVRLSEPPNFIELEASWNGPIGLLQRQQALAQVLAFGVNFGVCHSEFVLTQQGPVLIEINYRSIGDGREFMLDRLFDGQWFEQILRLHLGQPLSPHGWQTPKQALVRYYVAEDSGRLVQASEDRVHSSERSHSVYRSLRKAGEDVRLSRSNKDYLGALSVIADSDADLVEAVSALEPQLQWDIRA